MRLALIKIEKDDYFVEEVTAFDPTLFVLYIIHDLFSPTITPIKNYTKPT